VILGQETGGTQNGGAKRSVNGKGDSGAAAKEGFRTIILAAGKGKRMKSPLAKVLHTVGGVPMLTHSLAAARAAGSQKIVMVIGHQAEQIRALYHADDLLFAEQRELLGTGHAVLQTRELFRDYEGAIVILCGDVPLIRPETVRSLYDRHRSEGAAVTVLTTLPPDPAGYGRVVTADDGSILRIVEERDATAAEKSIREINTGIYCVESGFLFMAVASLGNRNAQKEYYLTDIVEIARKNGRRATSFLAADPIEVMGINTPAELAIACRRMETRGLETNPFPEESIGGTDS
jgi:UDP-N-acetylglucosamine diphosphorylase/glucosamine-1-phosphate N-acetyltransferase